MSEGDRRKAARRLLLSSVSGHRGAWARLLGWSLVEALPAFFSGRLVAYAIDRGFLVKDELAGFAWLAALAASIIVGAWGTRRAYAWLAAIVEPFRDEIATLAVTGALRRSTRPGAPPDAAAVTRLTHQVEIVRDSYSSLLSILQTFLITTVSALIGLLTLIPSVLVLVLPPLMAALAVFFAVLPRLAAGQRTAILAAERMGASATTLGAGFRDVVACGGEDAMTATIAADVDAQVRATMRLATLTAVRTLTIAVGGLLPLVLILLNASWLRHHGATTGAIIGALTYVLRGVQPPLQTLVRGLGSTGLWLLVTLGRILEIVDSPSPIPRTGPADAALARPHSNDVRFAGVTFRYGPGADPIVRGMDFAIADGAHLAIVGPSGIGKSTVANLVSGLLEPEAGELYLGGVPIRALGLDARASARVLIPQEAYVFSGTLGDNVTYLNDAASPSELDEAASALGADALIERLGGYDAELDPGSLSAGERQLITLVRAYVSRAGLVILDEATCHLDPAGEARVERALARRPGTLIVIAHRISSALRAQRILLLDGRQAMLGTHDGLLGGSPLYRELVGHWDSSSVARAPASNSSPS